jgi:hypothetical protein
MLSNYSFVYIFISFKKIKIVSPRYLQINYKNCCHCRMSDNRQQNLRSLLKQVQVDNWNYTSKALFLSFSHLWHINGFLARITRRVPLVKHELIPVYLDTPLILRFTCIVSYLIVCPFFSFLFCRCLFFDLITTLVSSCIQYNKYYKYSIIVL